MNIEKELARYIINETWDELFGDEEYNVDQLTEKLNKEIKRIKKDTEETTNE